MAKTTTLCVCLEPFRWHTFIGYVWTLKNVVPKNLSGREKVAVLSGRLLEYQKHTYREQIFRIYLPYCGQTSKTKLMCLKCSYKHSPAPLIPLSVFSTYEVTANSLVNITYWFSADVWLSPKLPMMDPDKKDKTILKKKTIRYPTFEMGQNTRPALEDV